MPDCVIFPGDPTWNEVFERSCIPIDADWYGNPIGFSFSFVFGISPGRVYFGAVAANATTSLPGSVRGEYREGLWEADVIELFLADDRSSAYSELNLAPNGAWWSMCFDSYRQRARNSLIPPEIDIVTESAASSTRVGLSISRSALGITNNFTTSSRANLCAIFGAENSRRYLSVHPFADVKPDFHLDRGFQPIAYRC